MLTAFLLSALTLHVPEPEALTLLRFPGPAECSAAIADGQAHLAFWEARLANGLCRHDQERVEVYCQQVRSALTAWRLLRECWLDVRFDYGCAHWYPWEIESLEELLGPERFAAGVMPYPVAPHWRIEPKKKVEALFGKY